jgi:hypothetical protein
MLATLQFKRFASFAGVKRSDRSSTGGVEARVAAGVEVGIAPGDDPLSAYEFAFDMV